MKVKYDVITIDESDKSEHSDVLSTDTRVENYDAFWAIIDHE